MRPFTRRQALENAAFLDALRQTGNARLAARLLGVHRSTFTKRRARSAAFAAEWEAALAAAHAAFQLSGGPRPPEACPERSRRSGPRAPEGTAARDRLRTKGGEPMVVRLGNGRLQLRRAPPGRMTKPAEQAFFRALAASANVRLSAAAAGFAHSSFYAKKRVSASFASEMRFAITLGHGRLFAAAVEAGVRAMEGAGPDSAWRERGLEPLPPMTVSQCIQLLYFHQNSDRLRERAPTRRARPVTIEQVRDDVLARLDALHRTQWYESTGRWRFAHERPAHPAGIEAPGLPPLHLVTGWSRANPDRAKAVHNPNLALFGGWRIADWKERKARKG